MATGNLYIHNRNISIKVDIENVRGYGNELMPKLDISVEFKNPAQSGEKIQLLGAGAKLIATDKSIYFGETYQHISYFLRDDESFFQHFSIPVSGEILSNVEKFRHGNLRFQLECSLQLGLYEHVSLMTGEGNKCIEKSFLTEIITGSNGQVIFEIEQSQWVNKILKTWKLNKTSIIELPSFTEVVPDEYKISRGELDEALRYFNNGDYDKTVSHCRSALEPFKRKMDDLKAHIKSNHEFEWMKDISAATETWLDTILRKTFNFTAKTHHAPSIGHFDRMDAQIITMVTTAIIGYVGKTGFKAD